MKVQFESPKTALKKEGKLKWLGDFNPTSPSDFNLIPNESGVYIIGVKLFLNSVETFFPLYVGEASNLRVRLIEHYTNRSTKKSNDTKEIFDLSNILSNYRDLYAAIKAYNDSWIFRKDLRIGGSQKKHKMYANNSIEEYLLYFQCSSFLNFYFNLDIKKSIWKDLNQRDFINHVENIESSLAKKLINRLHSTKDCIRDNFYFSYCILPNTSQSQRQIVEAQTKYYLEKRYSIYTSSDVTNDGKKEWKKLKLNNPKNTNLDFSKIDNFFIKTI